MSEKITVEVSPAGEVKVSVKGVKGRSCKDLTKNLELAFGDVENVVKTGEYNEPETRKVEHRNRV